MNQNIATLRTNLFTPDVENQTLRCLQHTNRTQEAVEEARRYITSVVMEVERSVGSKQDLSKCSIESIVSAMLDGAKFRLMIDGKHHAHLVKYGNRVNFMIGYRGYLYAIKRHFSDADFTVSPVYQGDDLKLWEEDGIQRYSLTQASAFRDGEQGLQGILVSVTYTDQGKTVRKVTPVPKIKIDKSRGCATQDFIWKKWYLEMAKKTAIKDALKIEFASLPDIQDMIDFDNQRNHQLSNTEEKKERTGEQLDEFTKNEMKDAEVKEVDYELLSSKDDPKQQKPVSESNAEEPERYPSTCSACNGSGEIDDSFEGDNGEIIEAKKICEMCGGEG